MRRNTIGSPWVLPKRPGTPWAPNPWINTRGPTAEPERAVQATACVNTYDGEQPKDSTSAECARQDKKQQKIAIRAWEDEGGSTAASTPLIDLR